MRYLSLLHEQYRNLDDQARLRIGIVIAVLLVLAVLLSAVNRHISSLVRKRAAREANVVEMLQLKQRYQEANAVAQKLNNRLAAAKPDDSPAKIVEEIGIKGRNSQIKPLKGEDKGAFVEDAAEVKMDGLTASEAVNLLFRLEKGSKPVLVKKALLKPRFDDPSRLDISLTIALLKPAPQGQR
jgi:general secretion pathway protein M